MSNLRHGDISDVAQATREVEVPGRLLRAGTATPQGVGANRLGVLADPAPLSEAAGALSAKPTVRGPGGIGPLFMDKDKKKKQNTVSGSSGMVGYSSEKVNLWMVVTPPPHRFLFRARPSQDLSTLTYSASFANPGSLMTGKAIQSAESTLGDTSCHGAFQLGDGLVVPILGRMLSCLIQGERHLIVQNGSTLDQAYTPVNT